MGSINFDLYTVTLNIERAKELVFKLQIASLKRKFKFKAANEAEFDSWCAAIKDHLDGSQGGAQLMMAPSLDKFWRHEPISE